MPDEGLLGAKRNAEPLLSNTFDICAQVGQFVALSFVTQPYSVSQPLSTIQESICDLNPIYRSLAYQVHRIDIFLTGEAIYDKLTTVQAAPDNGNAVRQALKRTAHTKIMPTFQHVRAVLLSWFRLRRASLYHVLKIAKFLQI